MKRSGTTFTRCYYLKDHLGTVKMTVGSAGEVMGYDDTYLYGQVMEGRCLTPGSDPRYKYTGQ